MLLEKRPKAKATASRDANCVTAERVCMCVCLIQRISGITVIIVAIGPLILVWRTATDGGRETLLQSTKLSCRAVNFNTFYDSLSFLVASMEAALEQRGVVGPVLYNFNTSQGFLVASMEVALEQRSVVMSFLNNFNKPMLKHPPRRNRCEVQ